jgi:hypothetical protein
MSDGCARTYRELVETTDWPSTGAGVTRGAPAALARCGYELVAVLATVGSPRQSLRAPCRSVGTGGRDQGGAAGVRMPGVT